MEAVEEVEVVSSVGAKAGYADTGRLATKSRSLLVFLFLMGPNFGGGMDLDSLSASGMESLEPQLRCNFDSTSRDSKLLKASVVFRTFTLRDPMRRKPAASFTEI